MERPLKHRNFGDLSLMSLVWKQRAVEGPGPFCRVPQVSAQEDLGTGQVHKTCRAHACVYVRAYVCVCVLGEVRIQEHPESHPLIQQRITRARS